MIYIFLRMKLFYALYKYVYPHKVNIKIYNTNQFLITLSSIVLRSLLSIIDKSILFDEIDKKILIMETKARGVTVGDIFK